MELTTTCNALNWIIGKVRDTGIVVSELDPSVSWNTFVFRGKLNLRMVREITGWIEGLKAQGMKFYAMRPTLIVDGVTYELHIELPPHNRANYDPAYVQIWKRI